MPGKLEIERDMLLEALRHLAMIVPSLARIGSVTGGGADEDPAVLLSDFMDDWDVGPRLSRVREILASVFDYDELVELFGDVETWHYEQRKPKRPWKTDG